MRCNFNFQGLEEFASVYPQETAMTAQTQEELLASLLEQQKVDVSLLSLFLSLFFCLILSLINLFYLRKLLLFLFGLN